MRPWGAAARAWISLGALLAGYALAARAVGAGSTTSLAGAWLAGAGIALGTAIAFHRLARPALLIAVVMIGAAWWSVRIGPIPRGATGTSADGAIVTLEGVIAGPPRVSDQSGARILGLGTVTTLPLRVDRIIDASLMWRTGDTVRVVCTGPVRGTPGERVRIRATLGPIEAPVNPGQRDPRVRAAQDRLIGVAHTSPTLVENLGASPGVRATWLRVRHTLRSRALRALGEGAEQRRETGAALVRSLILGEDDAALDPAREAFTRVGLSHVLAISGFHLVVLVWSVLMLVRLLGDRGVLEPLIVGTLVILYLVIVPAEAPVLRAGIMALAFLLADGFGRRHDRLAVLGWISCALLLWRPADALSLGFQLSVGLTGVLLWIGTTTNDRLWGTPLRGTITIPDPTVASMLLHGLRSLVSTSLLCWLVGLPLIAWHTGTLSLLAIPATLVVVPLCVLLMWLGFVALLGGMLWAPIGKALQPALDTLGSLIADLVLWFDESPLSLVRVAPFSALLAAAGVALAIWWCRSGRWRSVPHGLATVLVLAWGAFELRTTTMAAPDVVARLDTLAVGDGSCHILRSGGEAMLWDCGSLTREDVGSRVLPRAARALGVTRIRVAVLTHPNLDHFNGLLDAARTMGLRTLLIGDATLDDVMSSSNPRLGLALAEMERRGVRIRRVGAGDSVTIGGVEVRFLWPPDDYATEAENERSLVALVEPRAESAGNGVLLTGDAQAEAIGAIMRAHPDLRASVIELPHHGAFIRESVELLTDLGPSAVHQSTGPRRAADDRWDDLHEGRWWGVTAYDGAIWTEVLRDGSTRSGTWRER